MSWRRIDRAGLLLELRVEDFQQAPRGLGLAQAAELVQRLPLQVEELGEFFLAVVGVLDLLGELALRGLDDLFLLADLLGLLFQGVLALVETGVRAREVRRGSCEAPFRFRPVLEHQLLDLQLALAAAVLGLLLGLATISLASDSASLRRRRSSSLIKMKVKTKRQDHRDDDGK